MRSQAKTAIAILGGASVLALGAALGGGRQALTDTTIMLATPTSSVAPAPPPAVAPASPATESPRQFESPGGITGCIPHINC